MKKIKHIIFDFGQVIINIDPSAVRDKMIKRGITNVDEMHLKLVEADVYNKLETGHITADEFRQAIKDTVDSSLTSEEVDDAWNSMILDIPRERIKFMTRLKSRYKLYLLSNTNAIHYEYYDGYFRDTFDYPSLNTFFTKAWYSYQMGLRKPDPEIFSMVLKDGQLDPAETVFIDDLKENTDMAASTGIIPCHLPPGKEFMDLFDENLELNHTS